MDREKIVETLSKYIGQPNTKENRDLVLESLVKKADTHNAVQEDYVEVYIGQADPKAKELELTEDEYVELAQALHGPYNDLPEGCKFTLQELRVAKWDRLSNADRSGYMQEAKSAVKYLKKKFFVLERK